MVDISTEDSLAGGQAEEEAALQGLIYSIFQLSKGKQDDPQLGFAIGVVSPGPCLATGVLVHSLVEQLGRYPANRVLGVDLGYVARSVESMDDLLAKVVQTESPNVFALRPISEVPVNARPSTYWHGSAAHRRECVHALRQRFDYILFECPALRLTSDAQGIAPILDGFLMMIEGGRTTKQELQEAEHVIESAGGKLYGNILNTPASSLPRWAGGRS